MARRSQEERKAETRRLLLEAAAELFADQGIDAVSVDAVAEAAGRTSGAVYAHFGSKQGLLLALLDEWRHSLVEAVAGAFEESADLGARLRAVATTVVVRPSEDTRRLLLLERELWLRAARDPEIAVVVRARSREAHESMTRGFARWMATGMVEPGDPDLLATAFRALVIGLEEIQRTEGTLDIDTATAALASLPGLRAPATV